MPARTCMFISLLLVACCVTSALGFVTDDEKITVIKAGHIIIGDGEAIEQGTIVIVDGEIAAIGRDVDYPPSAHVIDARNQTVMPGLIHVRTRQGLPNYSRTGIQSNQKVSDEIYLSLLDSEDFLSAGYTAVCYIPGGVGLPGLSAVYRTGGAENHRLLRDSAYLRVTMSSPARDKRVLRDALRRAKAEIEKVDKAREEWEKKQAEEAKQAQQNQDKDADAKEPEKKQPEPFRPPSIEATLRPVVDLLRGEKGAIAMLEMSSAADLLHIDDVLQDYKDLPVMYFINPGAGDINYVVEMLGERNALIVTGPNLTRLPNTAVRYNLVADLFDAGAEVAIMPSGAPDRMRSMLADLVRSGLDSSDALRSITLNTARVVGLDHQLGSIAAGKDADLIFLDSHPLDGHSRVLRTMIRGDIVWTAGGDS